MSALDIFNHPSAEQQLAYMKQSRVNDLRALTTISATMGTYLPVLIMYILFSTAESRRKWLFWVHIQLILFAIASAIVNIAAIIYGGRENLAWDSTYTSYSAAIAFFAGGVPIVADISLMLKLNSFWPPTVYSKRTRWLVLAFPLLLKPVRIGFGIWCVAYIKQTGQKGFPYTVRQAWISYILFALDNAYCSVLLLYKSMAFRRQRLRMSRRAATLEHRLRFLIESIFMTFVPCSILSIVVCAIFPSVPGFGGFPKGGPPGPLPPLIFLMANSQANNRTVWAVDELQTLSIFFCVHFAILATSWSSIRERTDAGPEGTSSGSNLGKRAQRQKAALARRLFPEHPSKSEPKSPVTAAFKGTVRSTMSVLRFGGRSATEEREGSSSDGPLRAFLRRRVGHGRRSTPPNNTPLVNSFLDDDDDGADGDAGDHVFRDNIDLDEKELGCKRRFDGGDDDNPGHVLSDPVEELLSIECVDQDNSWTAAARGPSDLRLPPSVRR